MTSQLALTKKNRGVSGYDDSVISEPFARIATYNDEVQQFRKGKLKGRRRCCRRVFFLARVIMTSYIVRVSSFDHFLVRGGTEA